MSGQDTAKQILAKVGVWWPEADEHKLDEAAAAFRALAIDLDAAASAGTTAATAVTNAYTGAAADAFNSFWGRYDGSEQAYLPAAAAAARSIADGLDRYAAAVRKAKSQLQEKAIEIGATLAAGAGLAIFTFGISEAVAATAAAALVDFAATIGIEVSGVVAEIAGTAFAGAVFGTVEAGAVDVAVAQPIRVEGFHDGATRSVRSGHPWKAARCPAVC